MKEVLKNHNHYYILTSIKIIVSYVSFFFQTDKFIFADDQMVKELDAKHFPALYKPLGYLDIFTAWSGVSGRMVMEANYGSGRPF